LVPRTIKLIFSALFHLETRIDDLDLHKLGFVSVQPLDTGPTQLSPRRG
jgi:hypothetical protein